MHTIHQFAMPALTRRRPRFGAIFLLGTATLSLQIACRPASEIRPDDLRSYSVPRSATPSQTASKPLSQAATNPRPKAGDTVPSGAAAVTYELPPGWVDVGASGMRLATLRTGPGDGDDVGEITIIPASGTLQGNATRWQEQLTPGAAAVADRVSRAIEQGEKVSTNGVEATILLLEDDATENQQGILAAVIPIESASSLFVKFKGPAALARDLREPFTVFVRSIRWP